MKLLIFVVAIVLLLWLVFGRRGQRGGRDAPPPRRPPASGTEGMIACARCGVHLPRSEALEGGARLYCSDAHRLAGPRDGA
jgi:uncharacterized protein